MPQETFDRIQEEYNRETNEYNHKGMADALRKALVGSRLHMLSKASASQYSVGEETRLVIVKRS